MRKRWCPILFIICVLIISNAASAQDRPPSNPPSGEDKAAIKPPPPPMFGNPDDPPDPKISATHRITEKGEIKPLTLVPIPDDPPPHEGAMIDIPYIIEPPDILIVEVLEGLPGRPITGERLVKPDGTISLGFYGEVHVRGLTVDQAKDKIIRLLRYHLDDDVLGLTSDAGGKAEIVPAPDKADIVPEAIPAGEMPDRARPKPPETSAIRSSKVREPRANVRRASHVQEMKPDPIRGREVLPARPGEGPLQNIRVKSPRFELRPDLEIIDVDPVKSNRVFVDVVAYNSKIYFVQGHVAVPGRLPSTGNETVLDALNYAGNLVTSGDPDNIHLYRPARGGKPAKDYKIDYTAILKGDAKANLQIFPNDRLYVSLIPAGKMGVDLIQAQGDHR